MKAVFLIAVTGLVASVVAHFSTFFGINPQQVFPSVWILHILIFVVWFPVVLSCRNICTKDNQKNFWKIATRYAPVWMKGLSAVFFVYAFFNFFFTIFVLNEGGVPSKLHGKKVLHSHGKIIRELTDEEYEKHQAYQIRSVSGHWMVFYSIGMTVLYSNLKQTSISSPPDSTSSLV